MSVRLSKTDGLSPIVTFVSMIVIGVVIAVYVNQNPSLRGIIIIFFFIIGLIVAALELRAIIGRKRTQQKYATKSPAVNLDAKDRLARYVADLFEEDIPFDELSAEEAEMSSSQGDEMTPAEETENRE